jgi:DNA invertase Pin-like site-specific DNA recombinase
VIVAWVEDSGVSGAVSPFDRPALGPWLTDARGGEFDGLVAWKLDRITRRLAHFAYLLEWLGERKKIIAAVSDPVDTSTSMGRMITTIIATVAEGERETIRERIKDSKAHMRRTTDRFAGGRIPYGYWPKLLDLDTPKSPKVLAAIAAERGGASDSALRLLSVVGTQDMTVGLDNA